MYKYVHTYSTTFFTNAYLEEQNDVLRNHNDKDPRRPRDVARPVALRGHPDQRAVGDHGDDAHHLQHVVPHTDAAALQRDRTTPGNVWARGEGGGGRGAGDGGGSGSGVGCLLRYPLAPRHFGQTMPSCLFGLCLVCLVGRCSCADVVWFVRLFLGSP